MFVRLTDTDVFDRFAYLMIPIPTLAVGVFASGVPVYFVRCVPVVAGIHGTGSVSKRYGFEDKLMIRCQRKQKQPWNGIANPVSDHRFF